MYHVKEYTYYLEEFIYHLKESMSTFSVNFVNSISSKDKIKINKKYGTKLAQKKNVRDEKNIFALLKLISYSFNFI